MKPGYGDTLAEETPRLHTAKEPDTSVANRHVWEITPIRDLLWLGGILFLLWFGYYLRGVFTPVLIALLLAYLVNPLVRRAEADWHIPRPVTISMVLLVSALLLGGLVTWLGPLLTEQVQSFAERVPGYLQSIAKQVPCHIGRFFRAALDG
ncbi:MAG: AI-2E family transporter [Nitrospira sp.]